MRQGIPNQEKLAVTRSPTGLVHQPCLKILRTRSVVSATHSGKPFWNGGAEFRSWLVIFGQMARKNVAPPLELSGKVPEIKPNKSLQRTAARFAFDSHFLR